MNYILLFITLFTLSLFNLNAQCDEMFSVEISDTFIVHKDLIYGNNITSTDSSIELLVDIYEPNFESESERPLVILMHGGSFIGGNKEVNEVRWFCEDLAKRGVVAASVNYRLEPDFLSLINPELIIKAVMRAAEDAKASIRYFHKSIEDGNEYYLNSEHFIIGGTSAGALAALHGVFMDNLEEVPDDFVDWIQEIGIDSTLEGNSGNAGYSSKVAGVINISGALKTPNLMENNTDIKLLNIHNEVDLTIPYQWGYPYQLPFLPLIAGSYPIHQKMKNLGGESELYTVPEVNHVPHTYPNGSKHPTVYKKSMDKITEFLRSIVPCNELPTSVFDDVSLTISVYPNPTSKLINISNLKNVEDYDIEFINATGETIQATYKAQNESLTIDCSQLPSGAYFIVGRNNSLSKSFVKKIVIL